MISAGVKIIKYVYVYIYIFIYHIHIDNLVISMSKFFPLSIKNHVLVTCFEKKRGFFGSKKNSPKIPGISQAGFPISSPNCKPGQLRWRVPMSLW